MQVIFKFLFFSVFFILKIVVKFFNKLFLRWCLLEVYSVIYLLYIFLCGRFYVKKNSFVYFGIIKIFVRVIFIFSILKDYSLLALLSILVKLGRFPMLEWVIKFITTLGWFEGWLFFSLNKFIPFYILSEFIKIKIFWVLVYFIIKLYFRINGSINSFSFVKLISWSSIGRTRFFVLLLTFVSRVFSWETLFLIYTFILLVLFNNSSKLRRNDYILTLILFGIPPFSMFLFKVNLLVEFFVKYGLLWNYFFILFIGIFGIIYFYIYLKESYKFFIVPYTSALSLKFLKIFFLSGVIILFFLIKII